MSPTRTANPRTARKPSRTAKPAAKKPTAKKPAPRKPAAAAKPPVTVAKPPVAKAAPAPVDGKKPRVFAMSFASVYPLYLQKVAKKGRTPAELDEVIAWLTGYRGAQLARVIAGKADLETFFAQAPRWNPAASLITGVVCGVRVEDVADPRMQQIRYLDKLVDELAQGRAMEKILRGAPPAKA